MSSNNFIRGDLAIIEKNGGNAELQIKNATRGIAGFLFNRGGGLTEFRPINDSGYRFYGQFVVTTGGEIEPGQTVYQNDDFIGWDVHMWYDDKMLYNDITGRLSYSYDITTGTVTWTTGLGDTKPIRFYLDKPVTADPVELHITVQPVSQSVEEGGGVTFSVEVAGGTAPYSYQWQKDGINISGATGDSYSIDNLEESDEAAYTCTIIDSLGAIVETVEAELSVTEVVVSDLTISSQTGSPQILEEGTEMYLFVVAALGTPAYTYQWRKGGVNISGATGSNFSVMPIDSGDADTYTCVVTDSLGATVTSDPIVVVVVPVEGVNIDRFYGDVDTYVDNSTAPFPLTNQATVVTAPGASASLPFPGAAVSKFAVIRQPASEPAFTNWQIGDALGTFSFDDVWRNPFVVSTFRYYVSRDPAGFVFDPAFQLQLTH